MSRNNTSKPVQTRENGLSRRQMLGMSGAALGSALLSGMMPPITMRPVMANSVPVGQAKKADQTGAVGFVLSHEQFPVNQLVELGKAADAAGFDSYWTSDHFHPWQDDEGHAGQAWVTLAALGQLTKIPFGTGVTCPTFRYRPAIVAEAFASLGLLYPGRVFLGVGTGEALNETPGGGGWGKYPERAARLIEAVTIIKKLWSGNWVTFNGQYYQLPKSKLYDVPTSPVPLYIAASGPKSMALSGQYGDGLISDSKTVLDPTLRSIWETAARTAGKDPTKMPILAEYFVFVGNEKDPELQKAAQLWRFTPKAWTDFVNNPDPVSIRDGATAKVPLEEVYNRWTVSEDPQDHANTIKALFAGGVSQIYVHSGQSDQKKVIDFYGQQVLPLVRKSMNAQAALVQAKGNR